MITAQDAYPAERSWTIREIPKQAEDSLAEIRIRVSYDGDSNGATAEALDCYVLPLFKLAPKLLSVVCAHLDSYPLAFTDSEKRLIQELADVPRYAIGTEHLPDEFGMWWGPNPSLPQALMQRPSTGHDVLFKFTAGKQEILARSNGTDWVVEPSKL